MNKLFKINNIKYIHLIDFIRDTIKGTYFDNHVYVVGGTVRDWLLGKEVKDIDLVIDIPFGGVGFANFMTFKDGSNQSSKNPVVFPKYGTCKFQLLNNEEFSGIQIECVQSNKSVKDINDKSKSFGTIEDDAKLRDLTINSIYYNISTDEVMDITGKGIDDINNKILRTPINPDITFENDPLRLLRVIRFATYLGYGIEQKTWLSMLKNSDKILTLSCDTVREEVNKILLSDKPSIGFKRMLSCNKLIDYAFPSVQLQNRVLHTQLPEETIFEHTMKVLDRVEPRLEYRLAALLHDIGKLTTFKKDFFQNEDEGCNLSKKLLKMLGYSNSIINNVSSSIGLHEYFKGKRTPSKKTIRKFKALAGDNYDLILSLIDADNKSQIYGKNINQVPYIRKMVKKIEEKEQRDLKEVKLPINGDDIIKKFSLKSGPIIGTILKTVKNAYFKNPKITKEECFKMIDKII